MALTCKACKVEHPLTCFESYVASGIVKYRQECKPCRAAKRKEKVKAAPKKDPSAFPLPERCIGPCGRTPAEGAVFKFRMDIIAGGYRNTCNDCVNAEEYWKTYREKKLAEDADAYRAHNAATHLAWAHNNPENVREQQTLIQTVPERKFKALLTYAKSKNIQVVMEDADALLAKLSTPCYYCDYTPIDGDKLNGLDRVDAKGVYSNANTVACCPTCNSMKAAYDIDEWLHGVRRIQGHLSLPAPEVGLRQRPISFGGTAERRSAPKKLKVVELTDAEQLEMVCKPCYLCGAAPALGVDRVDASGNYTAGNVQPCCSTCNYMKKDLQLDTFKEHVGHVHAHTAQWALTDASTRPLRLARGDERQPVGVFDIQGNMLVAFPSIACAARLIKASDQNVRRACEESGTCRGFQWRRVTVAEYREQACTFEVAHRVMKALLK